ncbi:FliI/YscN family ATPase [Pelagicoccus albus]|uniref:FliI/YscN family ATPase n=1 Tax=Pelagicoccus albus TaxID=415222 RepID=A0A7X1E885_9BACT|nr:FliI/YscN family ATPase [Pelagicoccus albus]MBC2606006.1 FliI/YscN family ATPase [Pelagicoccus albus]
MNRLLPDWAADIGSRVGALETHSHLGKVAQVTGLIVESEGPQASLGEVCEISSPGTSVKVYAEVVGFREQRILLMPLGDVAGVHPGCDVKLSSGFNKIPAGNEVLGRVVDGMGRPIDGLGSMHYQTPGAATGKVPNPLLRKRITEPFNTGVKAIDLFAPVGEGQRMGVFAGSGVGKSTLLGMLARGSSADVNVIALVGERGRELREFIEKDLGPEGMARTVVVVATSDQSAPMRLRAANMATSIAENFRDAGKRVLFLMDSVTRYAMAQREVGLAVGEPPASRGYTPSVFSTLPRLLERSGNSDRGTITAFYTVLVEGDDLNEPIADAVRGILDGHIVLSRALATSNHFPAIDVLESISRLRNDISTEDELATVGLARDYLALYRKNEDIVNLGAYVRGANAKIDSAIVANGRVMEFLKQSYSETVAREESYQKLGELIR